MDKYSSKQCGPRKPCDRATKDFALFPKVLTMEPISGSIFLRNEQLVWTHDNSTLHVVNQLGPYFQVKWDDGTVSVLSSVNELENSRAHSHFVCQVLAGSEAYARDVSRV